MLWLAACASWWSASGPSLIQGQITLAPASAMVPAAVVVQLIDRSQPNMYGVVLVLRQRDREKKSENLQQNHKLSHKNTLPHVASTFDRKRARLTEICKKMTEKRAQTGSVCARLNVTAPDELNLPPKPHHAAHHCKILVTAWVNLNRHIRRIC